jgi:hypothetical protein
MKTARDTGRVGIGETHSCNITRAMSNKFTGIGPAGRTLHLRCEQPLRAVPQTVFDVEIAQCRRRWKWRVGNQSGVILMQGSEKNRPLARYQAYSALLLLLRANCLHASLRASRDRHAANQARAAD